MPVSTTLRHLLIGILLLASSLAIAQVPPPGGGSSSGGGSGTDWQVTYRWLGTVTTAAGTTPIDLAVPEFGVGSTTGYGEADAEITCTVKWVGSGPAPTGTNHYVKITPKSWAEAHNGATSVFAQDSLHSEAYDTQGSGWKKTQLVGSTLEQVALDSNGEMELVLTANAVATSSSSTMPGTEAHAGFSFQVIEKGILAFIYDPQPTYRRGPGGTPVQNQASENGISRTDTAYEMILLPGFPFSDVDLRSAYDMTGYTTGSWNYPLSSIIFSDEAQATSVTRDLTAGTIDMSVYALKATAQYDPFGWWENTMAAAIQGLLDGPDIKTYKAVATDSASAESKTILAFVHGPVEETGEEWATPYHGTLQNSTDLVSLVGNKFDGTLLAVFSNYSTHSSNVTWAIEHSKSVTTGVEIGTNLTLGGEIKALKLEWGADYTVNSATTYQVGQSYSGGFTIDPDEEVELWAYPYGDATFKIVAKYGASGYIEDKNLADVRGCVMNFAVKE